MAANESSLNTNKYIIAVFFFVFSYFLLFALGIADNAISLMVSEMPVVNIFLPFPELNSPMYMLMPVAGFFFMFFLVDWVNKFFKSGQGFSPLLPLLFFALSLAAFYVALFWYFGNYAMLSGTQLKIEDANNIFFVRFRSSAYYLFVISAIFGWISRLALEKIKL